MAFQIRKYLYLLLLGLFLPLHGAHLFFTPEMRMTHLKSYSEEEKEAIEKDLNVVRSVCLSSVVTKKEKKFLYLATAGGPGSRKTTTLERFLKDHQMSSSVVYLDPDQRALKFMPHTYYSRSLCAFELAKFETYSLAVKAAYEKWRGASNYITLTLMEEAFAQQKSIAHGTTSTGDHIATFFPKLKEEGYEVVLLLCFADDDFRQKAVQYRNDEQKFYQSTPEDAVSKGKVFYQKLNSYFELADTLYLFWSDDLQTQERLAAIVSKGKWQIEDEEAYEKIQRLLEANSVKLKK